MYHLFQTKIWEIPLGNHRWNGQPWEIIAKECDAGQRCIGIEFDISAGTSFGAVNGPIITAAKTNRHEH